MDRKPLGAAVVLPGNPNDGSIAVTFGKNDMEAWGDFKPPARTGHDEGLSPRLRTTTLAHAPHSLIRHPLSIFPYSSTPHSPCFPVK
jgi:hypothetical protein